MHMIPGNRKIDLRILATTDIHMNLLGHDYFIDRQNASGGLAALANLIRQSRLTHPNTCLFDNGDRLHGTPLGDYLAHRPRQGRHPLVAMMGQLGYNAASLGNHDFSFGCDFLMETIRSAGFPVVSSNLRPHHESPVRRRVILQRSLTDRRGASHRLGIGILGFLPPQTTDWDCALRAFASVEDIVESARREVAQLRAEGADLVIALAHSGIDAADPAPRMENAAIPLAAIDGIDVVIAGHTHQVFPSRDFPVLTRPDPAGHASSPPVDPIRGAIWGKPVVMPGFAASHLGIIDLTLQQDGPDRNWRIADFTCEARPADPLLPPDPAMTEAIGAAHRATLRHYARPVAWTEAPLNSFLSLLGRDAGLNLVNAAQAHHARRALASSEWAGLPVLSVGSPFRTGGRSGPLNYVDIAPGPLSLRDLAALYPFPNRLCATLLSGTEIIDWLERAASIYCRIQPGKRGQRLLDPAFPSYSFDVIQGIEWDIDLSVPPRYDPSGRCLDGSARRIANPRFQGRPLDCDMHFIIATNSYRLSGCGLYGPLVSPGRIVLGSGPRIRDILESFVLELGQVAPEADLGFRLLPVPDAEILVTTGPGAAPHLDAIAGMHPETCGEDAQGFLQLRLSP